MPSETPTASAQEVPTLLYKGRQILTAHDVARWLGVAHPALIYALYRAPDASRYAAFEIPKRSGGMRQIYAPIGLTREIQDKLATLFQDIYEAHPSAHGFIKTRSILTNARAHVGQRLVLNIDLEDFFPSINFGRVRGLLMAPPFSLGPGAAAVVAQACTYRNGLPQGAPTSPVLSNFIAASLDRRLTRLAKQSNVRYTRYADDITFSTNQNVLPVSIAQFEQGEGALLRVRAGEALERAIAASGFAINNKKVRLHTRHQRQSVTGLNVNALANVDRRRVRRIRAMIHAWGKFGIDAAARAHFVEHRGVKHEPNDAARAFRNIVYGELSFLKMVRGADNEIFLRFTRKLYDLDPNPSKFVRQMVFGADDFDVFISHASEDKEAVARPIFAACQARGVKAFLDEAHIGWGQNFATKINGARLRAHGAGDHFRTVSGQAMAPRRGQRRARARKIGAQEGRAGDRRRARSVAPATYCRQGLPVLEGRRQRRGRAPGARGFGRCPAHTRAKRGAHANAGSMGRAHRRRADARRARNARLERVDLALWAPRPAIMPAQRRPCAALRALA